MKISDLSTKEQTNEGFGDWAADTVKKAGMWGLTGTERGANKQSVISKQQDERAKAIGLKDFTYKLNSALQSAIKGGIVRPPVDEATSTSAPTQNPQQAAKSAALKSQAISAIQGNIPSNKTVTPESQYKLFNQLIESQILDEAAESVSQFITQFIDTQTRNLVDNPNYQQNINMIAKKLEDQYIKSKGLDPKLVEQAWETIWAWSQLGSERRKSNRGQSNRGQPVDMDNDGVDDSDERERLKRNMIKMIRNVNFNDPVKLKSIEPALQGLLDMIKSTK